jgi:Uma2 family endonuclease
MSTASARDLITFEDFCAIVNGDQKADLIDRVIDMASPDNTDANEINGWLFWLIAAFVETKDLGKVYMSRVAFRLDNLNGPEPDLAFVRKARLQDVHRGFVNGPPDLAVEVVSPDSVERDYQKKRRQYEQAGVREYWIVDELKQVLTLYRLEKGKLPEVQPTKGVLMSKVLPGFWLRPGWLWQKPLPKKLTILKKILERSK